MNNRSYCYSYRDNVNWTRDWDECVIVKCAWRIQRWRNTSCHDLLVHAAEYARYDDLACVISTALCHHNLYNSTITHHIIHVYSYNTVQLGVTLWSITISSCADNCSVFSQSTSCNNGRFMCCSSSSCSTGCSSLQQLHWQFHLLLRKQFTYSNTVFFILEASMTDS